jgi:4-hydroxybenzoate polyprenyltransferase
MKDDLKCGVRSTAILFGDWIRPLLTAFGLTFVSSLAYAGYLNQQGQAFYLISIGGTVLHLIWQYLTVDLEDPASCKRECYKGRFADTRADTWPQ